MSEPSLKPDAPMLAFLERHGFLHPGAPVDFQPLTGGVSSDIWRVDLAGQSICVKRALAQLKVAADWRAPVSRNAYEWAWMQFAARCCPQSVPVPLAHDLDAGLFAMSFLAPQEHPIWKDQLLQGTIDVSTAAAVGNVLSIIHASSANNPAIRSQFDTIENFYALRLEPYLVATALKHPDLSAKLIETAARTAGTQHALVHGDVSPKNILVGPVGPVLLDAECAWYGDPAFDVSFCLNHLILKSALTPDHFAKLEASFAAFVHAYFASVNWESRESLERRAALLLPCLMLARVDGKSPVEYITTDAQKDLVRLVTRPLIAEGCSRLEEVLAVWKKGLLGATLASC